MIVNKLLVVAAGVAGYVLGARAGRERYEQIREQSSKVWNSPPVQQGVDEATSAAKHAAGAAGEKMAEAASSAGSTVTEKVSDAASAASEKVSEKLSGDDSVADPLADLADAGAPPQGVGDPAAPSPGERSAPLPPSTPTSPAVTAPPTAGDLDPNKNL